MITIQIENLGRAEGKELYDLLANSEYVIDSRFELNYTSLSNVEVMGGRELLKILSEYYNES